MKINLLIIIYPYLMYGSNKVCLASTGFAVNAKQSDVKCYVGSCKLKKKREKNAVILLLWRSFLVKMYLPVYNE